MRWLTWSWIPGLHGITWLYAGRLAKVPSYMVFGLLYSLPTLLCLISRRPLVHFLLVSWGLSLIHLWLSKSAIERRIAQAQGQVGTRQVLMQALLQATLKHGGCLTVTQGVMETRATFLEVEQALQAMVASGYVYMRDNVDTGLLEYVFIELSSQ